tara:strand:+ start:19518 stop:20942 length:1425 start_codon:yes stop_codon:yes gene_type:complete
MKPSTKHFKKTVDETLNNSTIQKNLSGLYNGFHTSRIEASTATNNWNQLQDIGKQIKEHTISNLDYYLEKVHSNVTKNGGKVFFSKDSKSATKYILDLAKNKNVKNVIKGKSMISEEMKLNHWLQKEEIETIETDLGEYIIQMANETPFHIIAPAIHKSKEDISELFEKKLSMPRSDNSQILAQEARKQLRKSFIKADMGITGANFVAADTGTLILVSNEGNGRMCTSMPKTHIAIMGMEKIIPSIEDLSVFLPLLIRSATGQMISSYVTGINGPKRNDEIDGPEEFHLIIMDNGRSKLLENKDLRESLNCLRCGACLNACPVYRKIGGHSYGWVYSGPIGSIISPVLTNISDAKDLPFASSLCGACKEACPVKINIPRMLLHLRKEISEGNSKKLNITSLIERFTFKVSTFLMLNPFLFRKTTMIFSFIQKPFIKNGVFKWLPPPIKSWTKYRTLPAIQNIPFHKRWEKLFKK